MEGFSDEKVEILMRAIEKYGDKAQILQSIEAMSELTKELLKNVNRNSENVNEIIEEIADVQIMIIQLIMIYGEKDSEMDIFNKYVDYYAGQPGRGRAVWLNDELVDSFSILKDYDPRFSIRTVLCAALRTFIEKNASELAEIKNAIQKKGLF